mgnify:FL=1
MTGYKLISTENALDIVEEIIPHIIDGVFYYAVFFRQIMVKYIFVE